MSLPLLQTKFYAPPPRPHLVPREHLLDRLRNQQTRPLTLVCAPAGFGKTTLVSAWITQMDQSVAWLSLDEDDNDPARFFAYLLAALRTQQANLGETVLPLLAAPQTPPAKMILTPLLNDLATLTTPLLLVLDDYHLISAQPIHEALTFLLDHLPPTLRLIITSRIDPPLPLTRWRVRNQLVEVRADDLRFTAEEAALFLNEVMKLQLSAADIATLETRTEGWIAGLQLAALSMQGRKDVASFIQAFSGSNRHVLSYLVEEVLDQCPEGLLNFLLQTSILDRMSASLCNAVTGKSDGQALLEKLEQANLFLIPLDDQGQWHRYHHLFADVLRNRLQQNQADQLEVLHRRACRWYEEHRLFDQAMAHALAIADLDLAASLVERHATTLLLQSELLQLRNWVTQLPDDLIQARPRLLLAQGWVLALVGQLTEAETLLTSALLQSPTLPAEVAGELALLHAVVAGFQNDPVALTWAQQALQLLPVAREDLRITALMELALAYLRRGELATARHTVVEVAKRADAAGIRFVALDALATLAVIQIRQGQLLFAFQTCQQALEMVARWRSRDMLGTPPATGMIYIGLGEILAEWNDLAAATQALNDGLRLLQATIEKISLARGYSARARVQQARGDVDGALASFAQGEAWFVQMQITEAPALAWLFAQRARLWLRQGNLRDVARWATQCDAQGDAQGDVELGFVQRLTRLRLWLAQTRQTENPALLNEAINLLATVLGEAERGEWTGYTVECLLLRTLLRHRQNDSAGALADLERAVTLAEPSGYLRLFLDEGEVMRFLISDFRFWIVQQSHTEQNTQLSLYVNKLLASFDSQRPTEDESLLAQQPEIVNPKSKIQNLIEPLTDRELEILYLVADGLSNGEIADKLIVTVGTVKKHLNNIYGKLGVSSRTQAIARLQQRSL